MHLFTTIVDVEHEFKKEKKFVAGTALLIWPLAIDKCNDWIS